MRYTNRQNLMTQHEQMPTGGIVRQSADRSRRHRASATHCLAPALSLPAQYLTSLLGFPVGSRPGPPCSEGPALSPAANNHETICTPSCASVGQLKLEFASGLLTNSQD